MDADQKLILDLLWNLAKATEGLMHRTEGLADDPKYNDEMQKEILSQRNLLEEIIKKAES